MLATPLETATLPPGIRSQAGNAVFSMVWIA